MKHLVWCEKSKRIKVNWFRPPMTWCRLHSRTVYFNTHTELTWAEMPQTVC